MDIDIVSATHIYTLLVHDQFVSNFVDILSGSVVIEDFLLSTDGCDDGHLLCHGQDEQDEG